MLQYVTKLYTVKNMCACCKNERESATLGFLDYCKAGICMYRKMDDF